MRERDNCTILNIQMEQSILPMMVKIYIEVCPLVLQEMDKLYLHLQEMLVT